MGATIQPAQLLKELHELWVGLGAQQQGEASPGVLRACSLTLIALSAGDGPDPAFSETLAALMKDHPGRVIAVRVGPGEARRLDARVTAQCWMPFGQRQQVCCEQVEIDSTRPGLADLPPVIRALAVPDLPVVLWCRDAGLLDACDFPALLELAGKIIVNSGGCRDRRWMLDHLRSWRGAGRIVADLSWTRLTRWRETLAQLFTNPERCALLPRLEHITVSHYGEHPGVRALYMLAWLRNTLGAGPACALESAGAMAPCQRHGEVHSVTLSGPGLDVAITQLAGEAVEVRSGDLTTRVLFHTLNDYELLREELSIEGRDPLYESVLTTAAA